ncbi:hypothetical protein NMY22_g10459 [Coprinellus aureogranulatus]|nr:hypothetical protein NMY22_g10459 [Coprinellus aureogranulatus]
MSAALNTNSVVHSPTPVEEVGLLFASRRPYLVMQLSSSSGGSAPNNAADIIRSHPYDASSRIVRNPPLGW